MAKFELKKNSITLDLCGNVFEVVLTNDIILACDQLKNDAAEVLPKLKQSSVATEIIEGTYDLLVKGIENIGYLKDSMTNLELALTNLSEIITIETHRKNNSKGLKDLKKR